MRACTSTTSRHLCQSRDWLACARRSAELRRRWLAGAAGRLGIERPILWISRPWVAHLALSFKPLLTIYHVVDEYSAYPGNGREEQTRIQRAEAPVLSAADLVIVSSRALLEAKRPFNQQTFWVPNAVNLTGYAAHLSHGAPLPPELASVPRPRLGYLGQISSKLDFALLEAVARARPDWSLVFVGALTSPAAQANWAALRALPNVFDLGEVTAARVPEYTCGFDVGLMPYRHNEHSQNIDPLKLYDYLAAGIPIASVDLPALEGYRPLVHVGNTPAEFEAALEAALVDRSPGQVIERRRVAALNSWEKRVEAIADLIEPRLRGLPLPVAPPRRHLEPEPVRESLT